MRQRKIEAAGRQCERCGEHARHWFGDAWVGLQVHHLTYERISHEDLADLEVLCVACHRVEHGLISDTAAAREQVRREVSRRLAGAALAEIYTDEIQAEVDAWDRLADQASKAGF